MLKNVFDKIILFTFLAITGGIIFFSILIFNITKEFIVNFKNVSKYKIKYDNRPTNIFGQDLERSKFINLFSDD